MAVNTLNAKASMSISLGAGVTGDFANQVRNIAEAVNFSLAVGTGADQSDQAFADKRTLAASASDNLNIQDGSLTGVLAGQTLSFTIVKWIYIRNTSTTGDLLIGGHATLAFDSPFGNATDKIQVRRGGALLLIANDATGYAVDANDTILLVNQDGVNSLIYDIILFGVD